MNPLHALALLLIASLAALWIVGGPIHVAAALIGSLIGTVLAHGTLAFVESAD